MVTRLNGKRTWEIGNKTKQMQRCGLPKLRPKNLCLFLIVSFNFHIMWILVDCPFFFETLFLLYWYLKTWFSWFIVNNCCFRWYSILYVLVCNLLFADKYHVYNFTSIFSHFHARENKWQEFWVFVRRLVIFHFKSMANRKKWYRSDQEILRSRSRDHMEKWYFMNDFF